MSIKAHHAWIKGLLGLGVAGSCSPGVDGAAIAEECLELHATIVRASALGELGATHEVAT